MLLVASGALVVNGFSAWVLHGAMHVHAGHDHGHAPGPAAHDHGAHGGHDHGAHDHAAHKGHDHAAHKGHDRAAHDHDDAGDDDEGHHAAAHAAHLNLRGAWLHLLGDALGSLAAFVAGLAIRFGASPIVDPLASFLVVAILVIGALRLLRDAGLVLLDAAPPRLPVGRVRKTVLAHPGVRDVHALHVWSLGTGHDAVTVHVTSDGADPNLGTALGDVLRSRYAAEYVTVQVDVVDSAGAPLCALRE
jgi:cation diffusion facilitator family transporter